MSLKSKQTFAVLNQMVADGVIENYAVAGAIGAMFYVEPFSTKDLDVLVTTPEDRIIIESPGWGYLKALGYTKIENEGIVVEGWPVQFLPATTALEREAYATAQVLNVEDVPVRVARPEHLVAIMLQVGRQKDIARITMFLSQDAVEISALEDVISRHGLSEKWSAYKGKTF
ncbi:MAG: hypothetical protein DMF72_08690 [Acidobacteria bacterium]|nr:MAG: hypothetical protein DMF72_08690 [Acidobacteriota bacterium]